MWELLYFIFYVKSEIKWSFFYILGFESYLLEENFWVNVRDISSKGKFIVMNLIIWFRGSFRRSFLRRGFLRFGSRVFESMYFVVVCVSDIM